MQAGRQDSSDQGRHDEQPHLVKAVPPTMSAGPRLRAGFTDVPVMGMPMRCTTVRVSPITMPAVAAFPILLRDSQDDEHEERGEHHLGQKGPADR